METITNKDIHIPKTSFIYKLSFIFLVLGLACLTSFISMFAENHIRSMYAYLFAFISVLSLCLGALIFVLIQHITKAGWSVTIRRIPETLIALLPIFIILFLPIAIYLHDIFPWTHKDHLDEILLKKVGFLNEHFFLIRSFAYLFIWGLIGVWYYRLSVAQDKGNYPRYSAIMGSLSAPLIIIFALSTTFASFDWVMSLNPHWYSTIFGIYFFAGCLLFALSFMTLTLMFLQSQGFLTNVVTYEHYHDLGKLMFGFTVFWSYIAFSQFMLYWYGNIPEEIEFYIHRLKNGWEVISWAMPITHFVIPFLLLMSRFLKRVKPVLAFNCLWIIVVHLVDLYWLIIPSYVDPNAHSHAPEHLAVSMLDITAFFGLFFIMLAFFIFVLGRQKITPINDPRFHESLAFENF